jgi:hypothetical protein
VRGSHPSKRLTPGDFIDPYSMGYTIDLTDLMDLMDLSLLSTLSLSHP